MEYKKEKRATMKGQITLVNLLAIFVTLLIYMVLLPVLNPFIEATVTGLEASPNEMTPAIVMVLRLVPFVLLVCIVLTALNWAIPRREGIG